MESQESQSQSHSARADLRAREARLDWVATLSRGGGGTLALVAVAFAGLYLPGLARLGLVVVGVLAVKAMERMPDGPLRAAARPVATLAVGWLALAWGLGLLSPVVAAGLVAAVAAAARLWWQYRLAVSEPGAEEGEAAELAQPSAPPRELTPDERLDVLLADAPWDGVTFAYLVAEMQPHMSRATVARKLQQRADPLGDGRWRAKLTGP